MGLEIEGGINLRQNLGIYLQNPSAPSFNPTNISNLVAWYDGTDESTVILTEPPMSIRVERWDDKSGNGNNLPEEASSGPAYVTGDYLDFASGDYLTLGAFGAGDLVQPNTVVATVWFDAVGVIPHAVFDGGGTGASRHTVYTGADAEGLWNAYVGSNKTAIVNPLTATWYVVTLLADNPGNNVTLRANGVEVINSGSPGALPLRGLTVGARWDQAANFLDGRIGELVVYDKLLSAGEITQIEDYMANIRGITL